MAIQFGTKAIIKEVGKYGFGILTGTGITLASLLAWTGADDLQTIRDKFHEFESYAQSEIDSAVLGYSQVVVDANAEIGEYKDALEQANSNISQLITAYESKQEQLTTKEQELATKQQELATKETELGQAQAKVSELQTQLKENYVSVDEVNEVIAKANEQIGQANEQVESAKSDIEVFVGQSTVSNGTYLQDKLNSVEEKLDIAEEEPKATDIPNNIEIPTQKPTEQPQE